MELPVGIAQLNGVLKLNVVQDTAEAPRPLLLPINLLEALGVDNKLKKTIAFLKSNRGQTATRGPRT